MMTYDKKFLIITAHPDDLEMACGGLVAKIIASGGSVTNFILVQPSAEVNKNRNMEIVKKRIGQESRSFRIQSSGLQHTFA